MIGTKRSSVGATAGSKTVTSSQIKVRRNWMRIVGNLLIISGLTLMIGVGGYLAIQAYGNKQVEDRVSNQQLAATDLLPPTVERSSDNANTSAAGAASAASAPTAVASAASDTDPTPLRAGNSVA